MPATMVGRRVIVDRSAARPRRVTARLLVALVLLLVLILLVAVRPALLPVIAGAALVGMLIGAVIAPMLVRRTRSLPRMRATDDDRRPQTASYIGRDVVVDDGAVHSCVTCGATVALLTLSAAAVWFMFFVLAISGLEDDSQLEPQRVPAHYVATYDAQDHGDEPRWEVYETFRVRRATLTALWRHTRRRPRLRDALHGGWLFRSQLSDRTWVGYARTRQLPIQISTLPILSVNTLKTPDPRIRRTGAVLEPRTGSTVTLRGPRGLVHDTDPPPLDRDDIAGEETVTVKLKDPTGFEADDIEAGPAADVVSVLVANRVGRWGLYQRLHAWAFWGPMVWLLGAASLTAVTVLVTRRSGRVSAR